MKCFYEIEQTNLTVLFEAFQWGRHNCNLCFHHTNLKNYIFQRIAICFHHFWTLSKQIWPSKRFFSAGLSKLHFTFPWKPFRKTFFLHRILFFVSFPLWQKFSDRVVKIPFCVFKQTNRGKIIFSKKAVFKSVGDVEKIVVGISFWNCWQGCQNSILHVHKIVLKKIQIGKFLFSEHFWPLCEKEQAFLLKKSNEVVQTACYLSTWNLDEKQIDWTKCILFTNFREILEKNPRSFVKNVSTGSSKMLSTTS